jgi:hypothetical protein
VGEVTADKTDLPLSGQVNLSFVDNPGMTANG